PAVSNRHTGGQLRPRYSSNPQFNNSLQVRLFRPCSCGARSGRWRGRLLPRIGRLEQVNKELWILLSLFAICLMLNLVVDGQRMVLSFYTLPTLGAAYLYGRRQGTLTALGSVLLVCIMTWYNPVLFAAAFHVQATASR